MPEITINAEEIRVVRKLVDLYEDTYESDQKYVTVQGLVGSDALAQETGYWDDATGKKKPEFARIVRYLNRAGLVDVKNTTVGTSATERKTQTDYYPSNYAISLVREWRADEQTPWYTKFGRWVKKHLMKGVRVAAFSEVPSLISGRDN